MDTRDPFYAAFRGQFTSLLSWDACDAFFEALRNNADDRWYIYAVGMELPARPCNAQATRRFLDEAQKLLHADHHEDYCGIVYVDSKDSPGFIKIFDPHNLGVSCGFSTNPPMPGWVMSRLPPRPLEDRRPLPASRQRWWRGLWAASAA
jgi:hypothetical protein